MENVKISKRFHLTGNETIDGFLFAMMIGALMCIQQSIDSGEFVFNWKNIGMASVGGGVLYLIRKFTTKPKVIITTKSNIEAETLKNNLK